MKYELYYLPLHPEITNIMRYSDIRKTGKKLFVDMSRRRSVLTHGEYGLEEFKQAASRHWVEGVVVSRQTGENYSRIIVVVNPSLLSDVESYKGDDISSAFKYYEKDVDYKEISFKRGEDNDFVRKADVYRSASSDEEVRDAVDNNKGVLSLLRKDAEEWTEDDLQSFYFYFMVPSLGYRKDPYRWNIGPSAAEVVKHVRYLYGISNFASGWKETEEQFTERYNKRHLFFSECIMKERDIIQKFYDNTDRDELKNLFDDYCILCNANRGTSIEDILYRRNDAARNIVYSANSLKPNQERINGQLEKFLEDYAAKPFEKASNMFVIIKKTWD